MRHLLLVSLCACSAFDYGMSKENPDNSNPDVPVDLAIDVAYQSTEWSRMQNRCQVQVAFRPIEEPAEGEAPPSPPQVIETPTEAGACVITDMEEVAGQIEVGSSEDDWQVEGGVLGPDTVYVDDGELRLPLDALRTEEDTLRYELSDCSADTFPFSRTFALDVPDSDHPRGVHAFRMADLIAVGPQVFVEEPFAASGKAPVSLSSPLFVRWSLAGDNPTLDGAVVAPTQKIMVLQQDTLREIPDRWLVCTPAEEGWAEIPAEMLDTLAADRRDSRFITTLTVHTEVAGLQQATPWGRLLQVGAHASDGAPLEFVD